MPAATRILIVDDEPALAELMHFHLARAGYEVATAADGWLAVDAVRHNRPDLLLLDLMLPGLDGFGVCEILRGDPETATIPIIVISAWASSDSRILASELGVLDYLIKPFSPRELVGRVSGLRRARAR